MTLDATPPPKPTFFNKIKQTKIAQAISYQWRSYQIKKTDPLAATLTDAARLLADRYPLAGEPIGERNAAPINIDAIFSSQGSAWERLREGASEIKANVKQHAKRGALAGALGGGLTGLTMGIIGSLGSTATLGPGAIIAGVIGPGLAFASIGAVTGATGGALFGLCKSAYYLIANPEARAMTRLKRSMAEYQKLALEIKNNRYKGTDFTNDLKKKWLEIQGLRMGIQTWRLKRTTAETGRLLDALDPSQIPSISRSKLKEHLDKGADPFLLVPSDAGPSRAPLLHVCRFGDDKSFESMLKATEKRGHHPSVNALNALIASIPSEAQQTPGHKLILTRLKALKSSLKNSTQALYQLCDNGKTPPNQSQLARLLAAGADPLDASPSDNQSTALARACQQGYDQAVALMVNSRSLPPEHLATLKKITQEEKSRPANSTRAIHYDKIMQILDTALQDPKEQYLNTPAPAPSAHKAPPPPGAWPEDSPPRPVTLNDISSIGCLVGQPLADTQTTLS